MRKVFLIILFTISFMFASGCYNKSTTSNQRTIYDNTLSPEQMKNDLDFMLRSLNDLHPKMQKKDFTDKYNERIIDIYKEIERPLSKEKFYFVVQKSLAYINDAHTTAIYEDDDILPISLQWAGESLIINDDSNKIEKGSKIISMGGKDFNKIYDELRQYISSENDFWVKAQLTDLLKRKLYLDMLDVTNENKVSIRIESSSHKIEDIDFEFVKAVKSNRIPYEFEINKETGLAIIRLNECIYNDDFIKQLDKFFEEIRSENITKLAIDIRKNAGGDIKSAEAILTYFNVDKCYFPAKADKYDKDNLKQIWVDKKRMFLGKTYVLISNQTFSAGSALADIFKYNKLATLVGEPTGSAPSFYADPVFIDLPNSKIRCSISSKYILGANKSDKSNTVTPDIEVTADIKDIISEVDPVLKYIHSLINISSANRITTVH